MAEGARVKRKPIGKKVRFEIFKRDGFQCMYCGATPPRVVLHVDHITPVAAGGSNSPDNLITSCEPCNLGKSAVPLSSVPMSLAEKAERVRESEAQIAGYQRLMASRRSRIDDESWEVAEVWMRGFGADSFRSDWRSSIKTFIEKLGFDECIAAMERSVAKRRGADDTFRYFCGICWCKIREGGGIQ